MKPVAPEATKPAAEATPVTTTEPEKKETAAAETAAETEATEGGEETPADEAEGKETTESQEGGEGGSENDDDDDGGEGPISPITGKRTHLRLPEHDKVGRLAASFMRRNKDMGMEEAIGRAQKQLGIAPAKPAEAAAAETAKKSDLPDSVDAVDQELARIESEREKALVDLRFEDVAKFDRSMRQLDKHRVTLERDGERNLAKQETEYNTSFAASEKKATDLYDFAGKPETEGYRRMADIDAALKENNDPLYASPDKPLRIAQMVAAELKIAPRRKGTAVTPAKAAAPQTITPAPSAPKEQILPGGGSRTIPQTANPTTAVADEVAKITNPHQFRNFLKPLLKRK